ncbi:MAG: DUF554 domain-containing protein, partial [Anaerolineae bacterium]|nr:DUF554 domain-containing protein [Anaerolineae bacterium]
MPIGALVNVITVLIGSSIGLLLRQRFPQNIQLIIFQTIGLSTLVLGMQMALQTENVLILIFSLVLGGIFGEVVHLERGFETLGDALKARFGSDESRFTEGLITAFLLFCVGSMTFVGSINEGLTGDRTLVLTKSLMDGFTSIALASVYGIGVPFSVIPMFLLQGGLTLLAGQFQNFFS